MPLTTPGMYSLGTDLPLISLASVKFMDPSSSENFLGLKLILTLAYYPEFLDCFLCL